MTRESFNVETAVPAFDPSFQRRFRLVRVVRTSKLYAHTEQLYTANTGKHL
jgi:hypothetical protein